MVQCARCLSYALATYHWPRNHNSFSPNIQWNCRRAFILEDSMANACSLNFFFSRSLIYSHVWYLQTFGSAQHLAVLSQRNISVNWIRQVKYVCRMHGAHAFVSNAKLWHIFGSHCELHAVYSCVENPWIHSPDAKLLHPNSIQRAREKWGSNGKIEFSTNAFFRRESDCTMDAPSCRS